jgi:hypothetical protein
LREVKGAMLWFAKVAEVEGEDAVFLAVSLRSLFGGSRNPFPHDFRELRYRLLNEERLVEMRIRHTTNYCTTGMVGSCSCIVVPVSHRPMTAGFIEVPAGLSTLCPKNNRN